MTRHWRLSWIHRGATAPVVSWTCDAVLQAQLASDGIDAAMLIPLATRTEDGMEGVIEAGELEPLLGHRTDLVIRVDRRRGHNAIGVGHILFGDGHSYMGADRATVDGRGVVRPSRLVLLDQHLPDTVLNGIVGQRVSRLVDHPALRVPELTVTGVRVGDGVTVLALPTIEVDLRSPS